ncbi:hypothetical protein AGMMS49959_00290 [Planctomycetales bacterium]|nr:hypothetical protein AGMMS49959_00290 [Planctomycetales bacterium]
MSYLGIDVGSIGLSLTLIDDEARILRQEYARHHGAPATCLQETLKKFDLAAITGVVRTGSGGENLPVGGVYIDSIVAGVEGAKQLVPAVRNIIYIGGGSFSLTQLDEHGKYHSSRINSACASGTGAFLDQQALRLQVPPEELAERAGAYQKRPPSVATRCAVFAKSDMIHLQQEGFSVEAIAAGLCAGLGNSTVDGLLGGRTLSGKTAVIGGVAKNKIVINAIGEKLGNPVIVPDRPELVNSLGAALVARENRGLGGVTLNALRVEDDTQKRSFLRPPLQLVLSKYPAMKTHKHWVNADKSEIAIIKSVADKSVADKSVAGKSVDGKSASVKIRVALGIDIGSTSTKALVLDDKKEVVGWIYRKTAGDPISAVQLLFKAFSEMEREGGFTLDVQGVGTTGSGRKMIGALIGADLAMNEITAHAEAAAFIDPLVDTIIELGGQDAKFTQLQNGMVYNSIMNYVCAAGTGSFVEEQALKLGIPLEEYADRVMGQECPQTSDRCTVYMERDLDILLARGWTREQVAAAVLHSVRDNYLNKVVGGLQIGEHIYFQGATARNRGLVAAFEVELQKPIAVSEFCHVTGALGMCLLAQDRVPEEQKSAKFVGFQFADEKVGVDYETCELCHNRCNLSLIKTGAGTLAWGLKCGRDYREQKVRAKPNENFSFWREREIAWAKPLKPAGALGRRVGVLRSLGTYGYYPFWQAFLTELGCTVVLSGRSTEEVMLAGKEVVQAEYCAPVVMSHGHAKLMLDADLVDYVLVPHMLREPVPAGFTDAHFCCYVQAHPAVLRAAEGLPWGDKLLAPLMQFNLDERQQVRDLTAALSAPLGVNSEKITAALRRAKTAQAEFLAKARELGAAAERQLAAQNQLGIVCIGRPYNTVDFGMTLELPRKIAEMGYPVIYQDQIPLDVNALLPEYNNMYWHYGQKILAAAQYVAKHPRWFPIYFTNFMCGPDSYILTYFKEMMSGARGARGAAGGADDAASKSGKPYLILQFDGHGADAGYLTRIEAALESFHHYSKIPRPNVAVNAD